MCRVFRVEDFFSVLSVNESLLDYYVLSQLKKKVDFVGGKTRKSVEGPVGRPNHKKKSAPSIWTGGGGTGRTGRRY